MPKQGGEGVAVGRASRRITVLQRIVNAPPNQANGK
jgi:hypothetical protein